MNNLKNISIKNFLDQQSILPCLERQGYGMYLSPFRTEKEPSFKVDYNKNLWYDFGIGEGGSIIDLVIRLQNCTAGEAIKQLENGDSFSFHRAETVNFTEPTLQITSIAPLQNARLIEYLTRKRAINIDIAKHYCKEVYYKTNDKTYFAIGFQSDGGGWELRNKYFKGSTSPKSPTTTGSGSLTCMLFEGFMDMLSYLTMKRTVHPTVDIAVLNSVHNLRKAEPFLRNHQTIHCFLDNDEAGKRALSEIEKLGRETIDQSSFYRNHKDLNEYLISKTRLLSAKPHVGLRVR